MEVAIGIVVVAVWLLSGASISHGAAPITDTKKHSDTGIVLVLGLIAAAVAFAMMGIAL